MVTGNKTFWVLNTHVVQYYSSSLLLEYYSNTRVLLTALYVSLQSLPVIILMKRLQTRQVPCLVNCTDGALPAQLSVNANNSRQWTDIVDTFPLTNLKTDCNHSTVLNIIIKAARRQSGATFCFASVLYLFRYPDFNFPDGWETVSSIPEVCS